MNKTKLIGLSLLAFSAVGVMASCSGGKPAGKPEVYLRAKAAILTTDEEGKPITKEVDYKDAECIKMSVENEGNLRYGAQDVVITIEPQDFFTLRKYDLDSWKAEKPDGTPYLPVHPYVGLGSPHSLYSYQLDEGTAWTFENKSIQLKDEDGNPTGFYDEKYVITVKKEFFQKNIVIDYGNVGAYNNNVYVYNSYRYNKMFEDPNVLVGDYKDLYEARKGLSSYTAGSNGATVTYSFKKDEGLFSFYGWDEKPAVPSNAANAGEGIDYHSFKIYGIKKADGKEVKENIAKYYPSLEKQPFVPTAASIDGRECISFFIDWSLLAKGADEGYDLKYDRIEVELGAPSEEYKVNVQLDTLGEMHQFPCDFFQYTNPNDLSIKKPFYTDGRLDSVDGEKAINLYNILVTEGDLSVQNRNIVYATLFSLPDPTTVPQSEYFKVTISGRNAVSININNPQKTTDWRTTKWPDGETELPYWSWGGNDDYSSWILVQLNPAERKINGVDAVPAEFQGKKNLYCLYTLSAKDIMNSSAGVTNIKIEYDAMPEYTKFSIDDTTKTFGELLTTSVEPGSTQTTLSFKPNTGYETSSFVVKLGGDRAALFAADYIPPTTPGGNASIHIYANDSIARFEGTDNFVIALLLENSSRSLSAQSGVIGSFVGRGDVNWEVLPDTSDFGEAEIDKTEVIYYFQFKNAYAEAIDHITDDETTDKRKPFCCEALLNREKCSVVCSVEDRGNLVIKAVVTTSRALNEKGDQLELYFKYFHVNFVDNTGRGFYYNHIGSAESLGSKIGKAINPLEIYVYLERGTVAIGDVKFTVECQGTAAGLENTFTEYQSTPTSGIRLDITFAFGSGRPCFMNGMTLLIVVDHNA